MTSLLPEQRALLREVVRRGLVIPASSSKTSWESDPAGYLKSVLHADTWEVQDAIAQAVRNHRRVAVRSCHHSGKTFLAGGVVPWFLHCFDPALVITTAPTERQVKKLLWYEISQHHRRGQLPGKLGATELEISPTQRAYGFTTNEPEKFQGWHCENILFVVDEASGVDESIYEAIEGCLTGPNAKLLLIGNPNNPSGTFYEAFRSPLYEKFHISADMVPERLLPRSWALERKQEWGEDSPAYQVRVLGNFPPQGEASLISMQWVEAAMARESDGTGEAELGADIGRYGSDESVAYVRRGDAVVAGDYWRGHDTMASAGRIAALAKAYGATLLKVDDVGVGGGVVDRLAEEGFDVLGVNVGEAATDPENYFNLRTEIFQGLADRFKEGSIALPKDDMLLDQLTQLRFTFTPKGQKKLEPKEDMRKRRGSAHGWQSPDRADALALAFCHGGGGYMPVAVAGESREAGWVKMG